MLRRLKKNCLDLPAKTRVWRDVDFSAEAQAEYDRVYVAARREYTDRLVSGEILSGAEALVLLTHMRRATSIGKVETTIELVEELLEEDRQVVVFTDFKESAHKIAAHFKVPAMTGDMRAVENNSEVAKNLRALWDRYEQGEELTDEELYALKVATTRQDYVDAFQAGKMKVFVGTIKAGGVGITLTAADTVILHDRALTPGDAVQAEDRLHRIGQHKNVTAIWLQATDTDRKIDDLLVAKQQRIELVLAGKRKTMRGIDSIYDVAKEAIHEIFG